MKLSDLSLRHQAEAQLQMMPRPVAAAKIQAPALPAMKPRPPQKPVHELHPHRDRLNKLERRYAEYLDQFKAAGRIVDFWEHPGSLRLGFNNRYEPDFLVQFADHLEYHDTKGYMQEDSYEKIKNAATRFWTLRFVIVKWESKAWTYRVVKG